MSKPKGIKVLTITSNIFILGIEMLRNNSNDPCENKRISLKRIPVKSKLIPCLLKVSLTCNFTNNSIKTLINPNVNKCKYPIIKKDFNCSATFIMEGKALKNCKNIFKTYDVKTK